MDWRGVGICLMAMIAVASAQCGSDEYTAMANQHVSGGTRDTSGLSTVAACQAACSNRRDCLAVDVTNNPFACYFLTDPKVPITAATGVTHYNITRKCRSTALECTYHDYGSYRFTTAPTGSPVSFANCANACNIDSNCLAFASTTASGCQRATTAAMRNSISVDSTSKMMLKGSCASICLDTWAPFSDTSSSGGTLALSSTTLALCQANCVADASCTRVDFDGSNNCYTHTGTPAQRSTIGVKQYVLTRCTINQQTTAQSGCQIKWTPASNIHSPSGILQATLTTAATCQAGCVSLTGCLGVDFKGSQCWFHSDATIFNNKAVETGVTQYVLDRCFGQVTTVAGCVPMFMDTSSRSSPNGIRQASVSTLAMCKTACINNAACVAFDYDNTQATPSCWLHTNMADLDQQRNSNQITQYKLDRCPGVTTATTITPTVTTPACVNTWSPIPNNHGLGGTTNSANTLASCQAACVAIPACISLDFTTSNACYLFTAPGYTREDTTGVTHYRLTRCAATCQPSYTKTTGRSSPNGMSVASVTTEAGCKTTCANNASCLAFDYDTVNAPKCWLHDKQANLDTKRQTPNINQYILTARCPTDCVDTYRSTGNTHGLGGTPVSASTLGACQAACTLLSTCLAVDFTSSNACFMFTAGYTQESMTGVTHYVRVKCITGTTAAPATTTRSGCQMIWKNYTGMGSTGAMKESGFNSVDACLNGCIAMSSCVAVDYTTSTTPNECWFHMNSVGDRRADMGVTQYKLDRCFTGTTAPGCIIAWANTTNSKSIGATDRGVMTVNNCLTACIGDTSCVAADYDTGTSKCWLHMQANNIINPVAAQGINQFVINRCASTGTTRAPGCGMPDTTRYANMHVSGGMSRPEYTTLEMCAKACAAQTTCLAFDYDRNTGMTSCWFHSTLGTRLSATNTDHYVITTRCPGQSQQCPLFVESKGMHASGGIPQSSLTTKDTCQTGCLNNANCDGYDFDFGNNGCFFFNQPTAASALTAQSNVHHYELVCRAGQTVPPSMTTGGGTITTTPSCTARWETNLRTQGRNGVQQANLRTLSVCQAQCVATPSCLAVDYVPSRSECWFFTSAYNMVPIASGATVVNHYILRRCDQQTDMTTRSDGSTVRGSSAATASSPSCQNTWVKTDNTHGLGGMEDTTVNTLTACQNSCISQPPCVAIDHMRASNRCWKFSTTGFQTAGDQNLDHYQLSRCP